MNPLKFIFMGTPDISVETLDRLFDAGYIPQLIITGPDRQQGRGMVMTPPPVKVWADEHGIEVLQPEKWTAEFIDEFKTKCKDIELSIVVAYGKILKEEIIHFPKYGTLNIHYSLLPRWRGASPVESTILHGDTMTGITIQKMAYQLDAGDILDTEHTIVDPDETTPQLRSRLSEIGSTTLIRVLENLQEKLNGATPQNPEAITTCGKIKKEDGHVNRDDNPHELYRKWRAYYPWPGIFYFDPDGKRIKITEMKRIDDIPKITKIIPEGGKETTL